MRYAHLRPTSAGIRKPSHMSDPIALAQELLRCPSVTPAEGGALALIERTLAGAGFAVHRVTFTEPGADDVENLYARIGTASPNLVLAGHTDVVPPGECGALAPRPVRRGDPGWRAVRPRRRRHEGRDCLPDRRRARSSGRKWGQTEGLDIVSDHRGRGEHRGQRHRQAAQMGVRRAAKSSITACSASRPIRRSSAT